MPADLLLVVLPARALGLNMKNGELERRADKTSNRGEYRHADRSRPVHFLSSDYGNGCALLKIAASGGSSASEVYFSKEMRNHYGSSVLVGDYLYGYSSGILTAMKFETGEVAWRDRAVGKGSVIYADRHLYCRGEGGIIGLVEATPEGYKEKSRFEIAKKEFPTWSTLVIANGKLYLREQDSLYCYNIKR
jgi:hypothetical protein